MCPRCAAEGTQLLAESPVPNVWEVWQCTRCLYTWRTTEPARCSTRAAYPEQFRLTRREIDTAPEVPRVPPVVDTHR